MRPVFGEVVTASDVERLTSEAGEKAFVRLCATLIASAIGEAVGDFAVPNWSERINVPDRGVDGEFTGPPHMLEAGGLVGPGRNVYQFKWRRLGTRPARSVIQELRRSGTGALRDILSKGELLPDRYVLIVNLDLSRSDRAALSQALRKDCSEFESRPLIIWGAAEIAALLNTHPHLRHAFFSDGVFCTLEVALEELRRRYEAVGWAEFVGYEESVRAIQAFATEPNGKLLFVSGPPYSGKSRTVLEALTPHGARVVWTSDPSRVTEDHFRIIDNSASRAVLVIDDCKPDQLEVLERWALSRVHLKTILISRSSVLVPDIPIVTLGGLPSQSIDALLAKSGPPIPYWVKGWIRQITGSLPGLILYALAAQRNLPDRPVLPVERRRPRQAIGALLQQSLVRDLPEAEQEALSALAILPQVGVEGDVAEELATIAAALKRDHLEIIHTFPFLVERHLLVRRGRFVEVVPELLASDLATETFKSSPELVTTLWLRLNPAAQDRLLRRLLDLSEDPTVGGLLDEVLSEKGWFRTLDDLRIQCRRFHTLAEARPRAALAALKRLLADSDVSSLRDSVAGDLRREIVWSLEILVLPAETFSSAAELLLRLAEAENENLGNNATGVFLELFHWRHLYVSAPHSERIDFLVRAARDLSPVRRILVARAAGEAVKGQPIFSTHRRESILPPEEPARLGTWEDVWQFHEQILGILRELAKDRNQEVRTAAFYEVLDSSREMLRLSILQDGLTPLAEASFNTLGELSRRDLSLAQRSELLSTLDLIEEGMRQRMGEASQKGQVDTGAMLARERLNEIRKRLLDESFAARLQRWVGPRAWGDESTDQEAASRGEPEPSIQQIRTLAAKAGAEPALLMPNLMDWLMTEEAKHASQFFMALGERDLAGLWRDPIVARFGTANGPWAFGWYVTGVANRDREKAEDLLDGLDLTQGKHVQGILAAVFFLPASERSVQRLLSLFDQGLAPATEILGGIRYGGWVRDLSTELFEAIVNRIDDGTVEAAARLVEVLASWLYFSKPIGEKLQERAWSLLERSVHSEDRHFAHSWDRVASRLAAGQPGRFYAMLERTAATPGGLESAKTLAVLQDHAEVWKKLRTVDREGLLTTLLRFHQQRDKGAFWILWCLSHWVDPDTDAEILTGFANKNGEKAALAVADILDADKDGFWSIAETLIAAFPDSERIASRLDSRVGSTGVVQGSLVPKWKHRLGKAAELLNHRHPKVAEWARQVVDWLEDYIRSEEKEDQERFIWDYRISRRQLEGLLKKRDSPDRLWAIRRILKRAPTKEALELLTLEDIQEGLSAVDLPESKRRTFEAFLAHWSHRG